MNVASSPGPLLLKTEDLVAFGERQLSLLSDMGARLLERNCRSEQDVIDHGRDADALLVVAAPITARVIESLGRCRVIGRFGAGLDNIDLAAATAAGVQVLNVPAASVQEVSDHALAMILALGRRLMSLDAAVRDGRWSSVVDDGRTRRLRAQVVGIVGVGRIGGALARKLAALGLEVLAYDPLVSEEALRACSATQVELAELLRRSDYVSVNAPLTPETRGMLGEAELALMKPTAYLINVSRGGIVDHAALVAALQEGRIAGAGIDALEREPPAPEDPLLQLPNVILSPHAAYYSTDSLEELRQTVLEDVLGVLAGQPPRNPVNLLAEADAAR